MRGNVPTAQMHMQSPAGHRSAKRDASRGAMSVNLAFRSGGSRVLERKSSPCRVWAKGSRSAGRSGRRQLVRQRDPIAADGLASRRAEVGIRLDACELRALDEAVEESRYFGAAFRA
jgi:hypothetical protein